MATRAGDITFGVGFQVDKTGLQQVQQQLQQLQSGLKTNDIAKINNQSLDQAIKTLTKIQSTAIDVEKAMNKAFNPKLGTLNLSKFQAELKNSNRTIEEIYRTFNMAGAAGQAAFRGVATQTLTANVQLKEHNKLLLDMGKTLANSFKYSVSYGVLNKLTGAIQSAVQYSKALDSSLNDIRIVTDKSANDMERFAESANKAAKELGASTIDYTKASLIYYQQGLADEDVEARTDVTLKAANVTGQSTAEVSEQLTAVWNGYKVSAEEAELYVDKLAAVAATTASDLEELSTGMSKVASAANAMGVDVDQLNGMLSTIISVTRQAPESAGTALKTIFARMGDLELNGEDEFGVSLGKVSSTLDSVGVKILNINGEIRDMGAVIEEVGNKWNTGVWSDAEKQALAIALAGKRQYNNLLALFDNWDMYNKAVTTSMDAQGTLQKQQDIYLESTVAHLQQMKASWEGVKAAILKPDDINPVIDTFGDFADIVDNAIDALDGLPGILTLIGSLGLQAFGPQLGQAVVGLVNNFKIAKQEAAAFKLEFKALEELKSKSVYTGVGGAADPLIQYTIEQAERLRELYGVLDTETVNQSKNLLRQASEAQNLLATYKDIATEAANITNIGQGTSLTQQNLFDGVGVFQLEEAKEKFDQLKEAAKETKDQIKNIQDEISKIDTADTSEESIQKQKELKNALIESTKALKDLLKGISGFSQGNDDIDLAIEQINQLDSKIDILNIDLEQTVRNIDLIGEEASKDSKAIDAFQQIADKIKEVEQNAELAAEAFQEHMSTIDLQATVTGITSTLGAVGQLTMATQSIGNAIDQIKNGTGDLSSILVSLTMGTSMLVSSLMNLGKTFGIVANAQTVLSAKQKIAIAESKAQALQELATAAIVKASSADKVKSIAAEIVQLKIESKVKTEEEIKEQALLLCKKFNIDATKDNIAAIMAEVGAIEGKNAVTAEEIILEKARAALKTASMMLGIAAAVGIAVGAYRAYVKHLEEVRQAEIDAANAGIERAEKQRAEIQANQDVYKSYKDLYEQYEKGAVDKEALYETTDKLCKAYNLEGGYVAKLTGNYESLAKAAKNAYGESVAAEKRYAQEQKKQADRLIEASLSKTDMSGIIFDNGWLEENSDYKAGGILQTYAKNYTYRGEFGDVYLSHEIDTAEELVKAYDSVQNAYERMSSELTSEEKKSSELFQNIQKWLTENSEAVNKYKDSIEALQDVEFKEDIFDSGLEYAKDFKDFTKIADELIDKATSKEDREKLENYIGSLGTTYSNFYSGIHELSKSMEADAIDYLKDISEDELELVFSGKIDFNGLKTKQDLLDAIQLALDEISPDEMNVVASLRNKITSNKKLTKKELQEQAGEQSSLSEDYSVELADFDNQSQLQQVENLNAIVDDKIKANQRYVENIREVKQEEIDLAKTRVENLKAERDSLNARKQLNIEKPGTYSFSDDDKARLEELETLIPSITDKIEDMQTVFENGFFAEDIEATVFDSMIAGIDGVITKANVLKTLTDVVGENWTIAGDKINDFARSFPEIIAQQGAYNILQDGSVQLTELGRQALEEQLNVKQADLDISNEAYQIELQKQAEIQLAAAEYYHEQAENLKAYLEGKASGVETEAKMEQGLNDFKKKLIEDIGVDNETLTNLINENSNLTNIQAAKDTSEIYDYWCGVGQAAAAASEAYMLQRFDNPNARPKGGGGTVSKAGSFSPNREGPNKGDYLYQLTDEQVVDMINDMYSKEQEARNKAGEYEAKKIAAEVSVKAAKESGRKAISGEGNGKSSSSSKESEDKKQLLKLEDEIDLYREVNEQLEEVDHNLKILQKQEDRTYGAQHIENLKAQSAELAKQQKLIEKKLGLTKQDLAMRQKLLSAQGVQFGADGDISNYQALLTEKINNINALYTQYNNTLDKALKSTIKTQADNAKEEYESLKKSIEAYEKLQDQMDQLNEQWQDARNAEIDKQIEAFNYRIDLDLNVAKATKRWNEFKRKVVDDMENIADPVKKVIEQMKAGIEDYRTTYSAGGEVAINTGAVRETLDQFKQMMATGTASIYGNNPAQLVADLEKRKEDLMKSVEDAEQMIADMRKMYLDGLDEAYDKMEKHTDQYEYISNLIEHDINLIELLRGEEAYEDMGRYYDRQAQNNIKNVEFLRMQRDALREQVDSLEKDSKAWKKVYQQLQDTEMELRDSVNESVQLLLDRYENGLNKILKDLDKKVSGGMGVDYLQEQYEMQQDLADNYLDSVNQAYALEKLRAKFTKAINDTTDIKAREKLTNLLHEQVDTLAEKEKLAQYEVDHAEKMLEVEQARIALEEAQANKSQMRLKRDNQGNYSYQYVADEDAIDDAQQDLLDAENDLWNFDVGGLRTAREEAIKIWQEYFEKLREIWEDTSLTEEERQQKLLDLDNWRTGELEANVEKYNFFKTNTEQDANTILADLYSQNADEFGRVVMEEILPDWNSGVDSMIEKYAGEGTPACQEALAQLQANTEEYRTKVDELAEAAGMDFDEICNGIDMTIDYTYSLMSTNEEMIDQYRREMDELNELNRILEDVQREFQAAREEAIRMADEATRAIQKANELRAASEAAKAAADAATAAASQSSYYSGGGSGGGSGSGSGGGQTSSGGSSSSDTGRNYKVVGYDERGISITIYDKTLREAQEIMEQYNRRGGKTRVAHYDTGGYTGDWHSSEGKVAMLHEKEIVLNKHDTENMLDAVNVVRHIVASLDGSMLGRLADMSALAFNSITPGIETSNETLEQNVHIEASFPNATNRNEIEEAFNNLVNIASQKALNTRR